MKDFIEQAIVEVVAQASFKTAYRRPLVGFAQAGDPLFPELKKLVGENHLLPQDILPQAASVIAFFVPFLPDLVETNRRDPYVARAWAEAYIETNQLISRCCAVLGEKLAARGIKAAWQQPTHNFDPEKLVSFWSHKHVAFICGLGTFGVNHLLITASGCGGRLGSLVIDHPLPPSPRPESHNCLYHRQGTCLTCVKRCPTGALTPGGLDKQKCYRHLLEVDAHFDDLGLCDVCGKCATGPCAVGE